MTALGLSLVFGVMRLVNVAHGELLLLAAYLNFTITSAFGIDPLLAADEGVKFTLDKKLLPKG